jgi:hypothetical protein
MAGSNEVPLSLFAPPRITMGSSPRSASGETLLLRSSEKLADHPVTVVHSLREHARLAPEGAQPTGDLIVHEALHAHLASALATYNDAMGSAARFERLLVMANPASLDAEEITDKGYVNQRKVLARRASLVDMLYADPVPVGVVVAGKV